jgi:hypothetical protein
MATRVRFSTPAFIQDFSNDQKKQQKLEADWSTNIERWTQIAILGNPWDLLYDNNRAGYYDPTKTDVASVTGPVPITWNAFPNRIPHFFGSLSQEEQWRLADEGNIPDIPDPNDPGKRVPYTPTGARGWQDEYCEWSVTRRDGKIIRVDATCENSEYWLTLWRVDPERVRQLYQELVGQQISLDDLTLKDEKGNVVLDPSTGAAAYDPLNKFNNSTTNGVVHLVSGPNTLGAEIYLAAAATLMRQGHDGRDPDDLIRCAQYGREFRNSDPTIGASVYGLVRSRNLRITLTDPVGLYMSITDLDAQRITRREGRLTVPVPECVQIIRGTKENGRGLHIRFELPDNLASQGLTLSDLMVDGKPLQYGAQLVSLITMTLFGEGFGPYQPAAAQPCVEDSQTPAPMVVTFLPKQIYDYQWKDRSLQISLAPRIARLVTDVSSRKLRFTLQAKHMERNARLVTSIGQVITLTPQWDTYQVGTGEDADTATVEVDVTTSAFMQPGDVSLQIVNPSGQYGPPLPGVLEVVNEIQPREGVARASDGTDAVKQANATTIRASKSGPRRR